jgi:DNA polymerase-3 subunit beta
MRVSVLQENLKAAIAAAGSAVSLRSTLPVLGNLLLEAKDGQLRVAATDLVVGMNVYVSAKVDEEGAITVPVRLLSEWVAGLTPDRVDMSVNEKTQTLQIECNGAVAKIKGIAAADFPLIAVPCAEAIEQDVEGWQSVEIPVATLVRVVERSVFAASTDAARPTFTGVELTIRKGELMAVATDGYRLSVVREEITDLNTGMVEWQFIVPAAAMIDLAKLCKAADGARSVQLMVPAEAEPGGVAWRFFGDTEKRGTWHSVEVTTQLIAARFPDYGAIIPKAGPTTAAVIDRGAFARLVRRAHVFSRGDASIVALTFSPETGLQVTSASAEMGESESRMMAEVSGEALSISFNARYLEEALGATDAMQVVFECTTPTRPILMHVAGESSQTFKHVIMPMYPPR